MQLSVVSSQYSVRKAELLLKTLSLPENGPQFLPCEVFLRTNKVILVFSHKSVHVKLRLELTTEY